MEVISNSFSAKKNLLSIILNGLLIILKLFILHDLEKLEIWKGIRIIFARLNLEIVVWISAI